MSDFMVETFPDDDNFDKYKSNSEIQSHCVDDCR